MPTSVRWSVPVTLSPEEAQVAKKLHRIGKFCASTLLRNEMRARPRTDKGGVTLRVQLSRRQACDQGVGVRRKA